MTTWVSKTINWYSHWWLRVPEPRAYSFIFALAYLSCMFFGTLIIFFPPMTLLGAAGKVTMVLMGLFFVMGGLIGAIGGTREAWRLERIGVYSIFLALMAYGVIVAHTHFNTEGHRYAQMLVIFLSTLLFLARLFMIRIYPYKPRINLEPEANNRRR